MASHSSFESLCDSTSQWAFVSCGANEPFLTNSLNSDPVEDFRLNAWKKKEPELPLSLSINYLTISGHSNSRSQTLTWEWAQSPVGASVSHAPSLTPSPSLRWLHHRSLTFSSAFVWATLIQYYLVWGFQEPAKAQWLFSFWIMPHMLKSHWAMMSKKNLICQRKGRTTFDSYISGKEWTRAWDTVDFRNHC